MKNIFINVVIVLLLLIFAYKVFKQDRIDLCNPFGTDSKKNEKYAKGKSGEDYGVGTFWGKPHNSDDLLDHLNKIQWLCYSQEKDVIWRRSLFSSIIIAVVYAVSTNETTFLTKLILGIFSLFFVSYFSTSYYKHHVLWRRNKFIDTHIRKTKSKLKLPLNNKLKENPLI
jgi:uncharacterized protein YxeA